MHREPHREWLNSDRRHNMSDLGTFCQCGSVSCPHLCQECTKQIICGGGPLTVQGEEIAAEAVQDAILGLTDSKDTCQSVVMTIGNCWFW